MYRFITPDSSGEICKAFSTAAGVDGLQYTKKRDLSIDWQDKGREVLPARGEESPFLSLLVGETKNIEPANTRVIIT